MKATGISNNFEFLLPGNIALLHGYQYKQMGCDIRIYEEIDPMIDASTGDYRFKTHLCNGVEQEAKAYLIGKELTDLFRGAACITSTLDYEDNPLQHITLQGVIKNGKRIHYNEYPSEAPGLFQEMSRTIAPSAAHTKTFTGTPETLLIEKCKTDTALYALLKYFSFEQNWVTLYRAYDTLNYIYKNDENLEKPFETSEANRFRCSANNYVITETSSRHGYQGEPEKKVSSTMTLREAQKFIRDACHEYVVGRLEE
ncbi:hypothetical protein [Salinicola endophyticus]|uniref:Uncharacterized protein n=1 Tax=Salinicola endophyticus TaxID=1949083 RepID=A0AB74U7H0_9GAMM